MARHLKIILLASLIITISGCAVGPNFQKPAVNAPKEFRFDAINEDTTGILCWWELFNDPALDTLIRIALVENRDVRIAASRIEEARANMRYNKSNMFPYIGYEGNISSGNLNNVLTPPGNTDYFTNYYAAPVLSWEIGFWGKYRRLTESAREEMLGLEYNQRGIMISLISEVASVYFQLLDFDNRLEISKNTLVSRQEYLQIMQERYDKGTVAEIDVNQAQIQEAIAAAAVPQYERSAANAENALSILLGRNPGPVIRGINLEEQAIPPDIPPGLPSTLVQRRPDIMEAEHYVASQNAMIGYAQAMRFPSFNITGLFGVASPELSTAALNAAWAVSGSITGPLFNFGKNKRRVEVERKRTEQAYLAYDQSVLNAFRETEDALVGIKTYKDQLEAVVRQRDAAANAAKLSRARYDEGITSYLEVLDSERTLFDASLNASAMLNSRLNSYIDLYKAIGGGWISREEKKAAEQAAKEQAQ